jgi:hypothetical protein
MRDKTKKLIEETFSPNKYTREEVAEGIKFLSHFSDGGALYLCRFFETARMRRKPLLAVLAVCETHWYKWWANKDDPERRGDPDNPKNGCGMRNACVLLCMYKELGIPVKML